MSIKTITVLMVSPEKYNSNEAGKEFVWKIDFQKDKTAKLMNDTLESLKAQIENESTTPTEAEEYYYPWAYTTKSGGVTTGGNFKCYPNQEVQEKDLESCINYFQNGVVEWMRSKKFLTITIKEKKQEEYFVRIEGDFEVERW